VKLVAFLRAINVGKRRVKMDVLGSSFEALKLRNVTTFIASGNVVFETRSTDHSKLERRIEKRLLADLGYDVDTFLRSLDEVRALVDAQPFETGDDDIASLGFLHSTPPRNALAPLETKIDRLAIGERAFYWTRFATPRDSKLSGARIEKTLDAATTVRNLSSLEKLLAKHG